MLPDVQLLKPDFPIELSRVGAIGIRKLVQVSRKGKRPIILISTFDVFVDLPPHLKGVSLSRNFEVIDEVIENLTAEPIENIEELTIKIAENLLEKHEYATKSEVSMVADFIMRKKAPKSDQRTQEVVKIFSDATIVRNGKKMSFVGAEVSGITACPCAQELLRSKTMERLKEIGFSEQESAKILNVVPIASHNQRGRARIKIQVREDFHVSISKLIEIAKSGMSFETFEILKREDELEVVEIAHRNAMFVEDSVRKMAVKILKSYPKAPDDIVVFLRQENEESIHQHNVVAEKIATIGELRDELNSNFLS
ncbi:MAG: GTP cyclohydrolase MptA [Archaeoglobaceae archaeon]|nr:GTP cyclohydrolase MptA [Archaeoglobaceae archaeon]MDW7989260.1 GTP cyclohydrolase MptA [Archaeoglobaceae archaeon]